MKKLFCLFAIIVALFPILLCSCEKDETTDGTGKSVDLSRDLVLLMNFDNISCDDVSGKGNHGVPIGDVQFVTDTPTGAGRAVSIDGTDRQFINIPYDLVGDSVNYSVSLWIKDFGTGPVFSCIKGNNAYAPTLLVRSDITPLFYYNSYYSTDLSMSLESYQATGWHMMTITASGVREEIDLYLDGQRIDSKYVGRCKSGGTKMQIGGNADNSFDAWADPMIVDNFRVYRRCLSSKEVLELYKKEKGNV